MRLTSPSPGIDFKTNDIYGEPVSLGEYAGKGVMLCFFRDAACPFCNFRVYELTRKYSIWHRAGLEIIAVFSDSAKAVRQHVDRHPRPFRMIGDPELEIYKLYGIEHSTSALFKALLFRAPRVYRGIRTGGRPTRNPHPKIVPADFIIDTDGRIVDTWYGRDTADHIPLKRIQSFVDELARRGQTRTEQQLLQLQTENRKLRKALVLLNRKFKREGWRRK